MSSIHVLSPSSTVMKCNSAVILSNELRSSPRTLTERELAQPWVQARVKVDLCYIHKACYIHIGS